MNIKNIKTNPKPLRLFQTQSQHFFKERIVKLSRVIREQERGKYLTMFTHDLSHYKCLYG